MEQGAVSKTHQDHDHAHDHHAHGHADDHGHDHDHDHDHDHAHGTAKRANKQSPAAGKAAPGAHTHQAHHGHHHHHGGSNEFLLKIALGITVAFMVVEFVGGWIADSLALIADAGHMLADAGSLTLAIFALRASRQPANETYSYGHHRYEVLAAFVNGLMLLALSAWIVAEAVQRLIAPQPVQAKIMMITATLGLLANLGAFAVLRKGSHNENLRAALLHVMSDLLGSAAAIVAGAVILLTGWLPADPILSAVVALLILRGGWALTRESAHILLEGVPPGLDAAAVERDLCEFVPGVNGVHHLHAWALTGERPMMTLHVVIDRDADRDVALELIQQRLSERFGIHHATVQIEPECCDEGHLAEHGCAAPPGYKRVEHETAGHKAGEHKAAEPHPRGDRHGHH